MTGPLALSVGIGVCMVAVLVAMVLTATGPRICCGPESRMAQTAPVVMSLAAVVGIGVLQVVDALDAPGWIDDTATAAVVTALAAAVAGRRAISVAVLFSRRTGRWRGVWGDWWHGSHDGSDGAGVR